MCGAGCVALQESADGPKLESALRQVPEDQRTIARARGRGKSGKLSRRLKISRLVLGQGSAESRELTVDFQSPETRLRLDHTGRRLSQSHRGIAPALHVSCDAADRTLHVLDRVGAGQRPAQLGRWAYFAVARVTGIEPDPKLDEQFYAHVSDYV